MLFFSFCQSIYPSLFLFLSDILRQDSSVTHQSSPFSGLIYRGVSGKKFWEDINSHEPGLGNTNPISYECVVSTKTMSTCPVRV